MDCIQCNINLYYTPFDTNSISFPLYLLSKHPLAIKAQASDFTGSGREEDKEEGRQMRSTSVELTDSYSRWRENSVSHKQYSSRKLEPLLEYPGDTSPFLPQVAQLIAESDPSDTPIHL